MQYDIDNHRISVLVGKIMRIYNKKAYEWTISLMDIKPSDHILEVGFGHGWGIQKVAELTPNGLVAGIDFSEIMVNQARKLNAKLIETGRID